MEPTATVLVPAAPAARFESLDALRGVAAFCVLTFHLLALLGATGWWTLTPLYRGAEAVLLFFMLSGFVLSLPFLRGPVPALPFIVRRVCRIWIPYVVALALALGWRAGFVVFLGSDWPLPTLATIAAHLLLIGFLDMSAINAVVWTLVHEMRLSLVFPLIARITLRGPTWPVLSGAAALAATGLVANQLSQEAGWPNDLFNTLHYLLFFVVGAMLARHRPALLAAWAKLGPLGRGIALVASLAAYVGAAPLAAAWQSGASAARVAGHDALVGVACAVVLVAALAPGAVQAALGLAPCRFLGRVSYSLYLVHLPVLSALHGQLEFRGATFVGLAFAVSLILAMAGERWVEQPAIALGRRLAIRLAPTPA